MYRTVRPAASRARRVAAALACTTLAGAVAPYAMADPAPHALRTSLDPVLSTNGVEQRARVLLDPHSDTADRWRTHVPIPNKGWKLARDAILPGLHALRDSGPLDDGSTRRANVAAERDLARSETLQDQEPQPIGSIAESMRSTLAINEGIQASLHRAEAAAQELAQAYGAMLPKLSFAAEIGSDDPRENWNDRRDGRVEVSLAMPLFSSGSRVNAVRAAEARRDAAEFTVLAEERREMLRAATAHLDVIAATLTVSALEENVVGMKRTLGAARALAAAGETSRADISLAEANLAAAKGELASGRQALHRARIEHRSLTGRDASSGLTMPNTDHLVPQDIDSVVANALARSPDVMAGWRTADAQRYAARATSGALGPNVSLTGALGRDYKRDETRDGWQDWDAAVGVRLSVPLVDAEALPRVRAARAQARAAEWEARDTARGIERRVRIAYSAHASAVERHAHASKQVEAIRQALRATRAEYAAGYLAITDVTRAQLDLARARIELASLERDRHRAAYTLALAAEIPVTGR